MGQIGQVLGKWDNGLFTKGIIDGIEFQFLVDSGSTTTLMSHKSFQSLSENIQSLMRPATKVIKDVNGHNLHVYGSVTLEMVLGDVPYLQNITVCDMAFGGILGQDFLLDYATKIDYKRLVLQTEDTCIPCWIGGEAAMTCRVEVRNTVEIPANSSMFVPVCIPECEHLADIGLIEPSKELCESKNIILTPGVISTQEVDKVVNIANRSSLPVVLQSNMKVGSCESFYEAEPKESERCASVVVDISSEIPASEQLPEYLIDLWKRSSVHLSNEESEALADLLVRYQSAFSKSSDDLGRSDKVQHRINTGQAVPIKQAPRRLPIGKRETEKAEVEKLLDRGLIEPSISAWSSPTVLVNKKDGSTRLCIDYRKLNDVTVKDAYPLPRVDECLDALSGSKWFSCMDLNSGFYQIGMAPEDRDKTAFATSFGLYQFLVTPFGLVNAPPTFERLMSDVLRGLQWEECLLYMDDIIVPAATFEEHLQRLEHVFQRLLVANLKLKPSKCIFFQKQVGFLGHVVSEQGIHTDPEKIKAVQEWPQPKNVKHMRSFLGLCSYYRRFVEGFAKIARPLHKICEKGVKFHWTLECQQAFDNLKRALVTPPILAYPNPGAPFILDTDASDKAVGAVLSQEQDSKERVIAYMSNTMNKHEQSYCITRKELLAVVTALKKFHCYLYGQEITLRTDNAAVSWMKNLKNPTGQTARWLQVLGTYNLNVVHRPGRVHGNADALSRAPCKSCSNQENLNRVDDNDEAETCSDNETNKYDSGHALIATSENINVIRAVTRDKSETQEVHSKNQFLLHGWDAFSLRQEQMSDPDIGVMLLAVEEKIRPEWSNISSGTFALKTLWRHWDRLELDNGVLYRRWYTDDKDSNLQLVVPSKLKTDVIKNHHDIPSAGHLGHEKTLEKIKQNYYWSGMKQHVAKYCNQCDRCAARKPCQKTNRAPLGQYHVGEPMERVAIDILGPLPLTEKGNKYILVISDCFTRWPEALAIPDQEAVTVAKALVNDVICRFGTPLQIHSDQGSNFESNVFKELCELLQIDKTRTTSKRPQSNGMVERFNRTLTAMLTAYCEKNQRCWDEYLPQVMMAYRASKHASTGKTPNKMMLGREVTLPMQAVTSRPHSEGWEDVDDYIEKLQEKLKLTHELARRSIRQQACYQKRHYDLRAKKRSLAAGQAVWLHDPTRKVGVCHKLTCPWKGPFLITKKVDDTTYLVKKKVSLPAKAFHIDRLRAYQGQCLPVWLKKVAREITTTDRQQ